mgnify:CR=1 FL=1
MLEQVRTGWGKAEYIIQVPRWLQLGLLLCGIVGMMSDVSFIFQTHTLSSLPAWFLAEVIMSYLAAGISLISIRSSIILTVLAMATTFIDGHQPFFPLIPVIVVALAATALCKKGPIIAHCSLTIMWGTLIAWQRGIVIGQQMVPGAFWWVTLWAILLGCLVGLTIRHLIIRTANAQDELRKAKARTDQIRREERQDLARELHDVVAHHITVITMQVMSRRHSQNPVELRETLGIIDDSAREALSELRALLDVLRTDEKDGPRPLSNHVGTGPSLQKQVEHHVDALTRLEFQVTKASVDPRIESLPLSTKTTSARIVQESVTNIIKHAHHGTTCTISLSLQPTEVEIRIINNRVKSPEHHSPTGYGLTSLRERVLAVGGSYQAGRQDDKWVVEAHLPVHQTRRPSWVDGPGDSAPQIEIPK